MSGDHFDVVRARPSFDEMLESRYHPAWIGRNASADRRPGRRRAGADDADRDRPAASAIRSHGVIRRTRAGMALERALRAFWPLGALLAALWAALAFGARRGAAAARSCSAVSALAGLGARSRSLVRGLRRFRWPTATQARGAGRRDAARPAARGAAPTGRRSAATIPAPQAVWAAHLARMRAARRRGARRAARPAAVARRSLGAAADGAGRADRGGGLRPRRRGQRPRRRRSRPSGAAAVATGPSFEAWAEPPGLYRPADALPARGAGRAAPVSVPQGTRGHAARLRRRRAVRAQPRRVSGGAPPALAEAAPGHRRRRSSRSAPERRRSTLARGRRASSGPGPSRWSPTRRPRSSSPSRSSRAPTGETQLAYVAPRRLRRHRRPGRDHARPRRRSTAATAWRSSRRRAPPLIVDLPLPMSGDRRRGRRDAGRGLLQASLGPACR